jgi:hypothetical protein
MDQVKRRVFIREMIFCGLVFLCPLLALSQQQQSGNVLSAAGNQLLALANRAREQAGVGELQWDDGLAEAARAHCLLMASEGTIAHRYGGEADLSTRAGQAGAHFDMIEENVALGTLPAVIHDGWMHSPGHRKNLLNPDVNRVGIAVVALHGIFYATADYARAVQTLTPDDVEARIASLLGSSGVAILNDNALARAACAMHRGWPGALAGNRPDFSLRWQDSRLKHLPKELADNLATGQYHNAAVGSCAAQGIEGDFTAYRIVVLLYQ